MKKFGRAFVFIFAESWRPKSNREIEACRDEDEGEMAKRTKRGGGEELNTEVGHAPEQRR